MTSRDVNLRKHLLSTYCIHCSLLPISHKVSHFFTFFSIVGFFVCFLLYECLGMFVALGFYKKIGKDFKFRISGISKLKCK